MSIALVSRATRLAVVALFLSATLATLAGSQVRAATATWSVDTLATIAGESLRAEYGLLISGDAPSRALVSQVDEFGNARDGLRRADKTLARRGINARYGLSFTSADVALTNIAVVVSGSEVRLSATERATLGFVSVHYPRDSARDQNRRCDAD